MRLMEITLEITIAGITEELDCEVGGSANPLKSASQNRDGSWNAPEGGDVDDLDVGYYTRKMVQGRSVKVWHDVTDFLSKEQLERIAEDYYEHVCNCERDAKEHAAEMRFEQMRDERDGN